MKLCARRFVQWASGLSTALLLGSCAQMVGPNPVPPGTVITPAVLPALAAPVAARKAHEFSHHGIKVADPYAWLRDSSYPKVDDAEVLQYLNDENAYYDAYMQPHQGLVQALFLELKARQPRQDESVPAKDGDYWYQWRFLAGQEYRSWWRAPVSAPSEWSIYLDENALAQGHEQFRLGALMVSPDGTKLAYSTDTNGAEQYELRIRDLDTNNDLADVVQGVIGVPVWSANSQTLLYSKLNDKWRPFQVWRHQLGASADTLLYEESDMRFRVGVGQTQSRDFLTIETATHDTTEIRLLDAHDTSGELRLIAPRREGHEYLVDHRRGFFYILTNDTHPNFSLVRAPEALPTKAHWQTIIAPSSGVYLRSMTTFADTIAIAERRQGLDHIRLLDANHQMSLVKFPEALYTVSLGNNPEYDVKEIRLNYQSMVTPKTVFDYALDKQKLVSRKVAEIPSGYDSSGYETRRLLATGRDGTKIPVSVVHAKGYPLDGTQPLYLYGYGAYGQAIPPGFSTNRLSLLQRGFAFAIAHVRGGDDLGPSWADAGKLKQRNNTFNDFVDVAKFMVDQGYGAPGKIAIAGGSAGGQLMGAVVNQAPELWGAVAAHVPFVDVLTTMLDASLPLTPPEWNEWGNPIEDAEAFRFIQSYSPYDQLQSDSYPPMMVTAGLNDPRVTYWEPAKYVAKLRYVKQGDSPLIFKTNMGAGHQGKSGRFTRLEEVAEEFAFFLTNLNDPQ